MNREALMSHSTNAAALRLLDEQYDDYGVMCIVSRQAVDEAIAEIERLRAEVADWRRQAMQRSEDWREQNARAEKAESALADLRKRVEEAPVVEWSPYHHCDSVSPSYIGKRVALVVLGEG